MIMETSTTTTETSTETSAAAAPEQSPPAPVDLSALVNTYDDTGHKAWRWLEQHRGMRGGDLQMVAEIAQALQCTPAEHRYLADREIGRSIPAVGGQEAAAALALMAGARQTLEHHELELIAHARAHGLTWAQLAAVTHTQTAQIKRRHTVLRRRFPGYRPPRPNLAAHLAACGPALRTAAAALLAHRDALLDAAYFPQGLRGRLAQLAELIEAGAEDADLYWQLYTHLAHDLFLLWHRSKPDHQAVAGLGTEVKKLPPAAAEAVRQVLDLVYEEEA
jgi:hypothetical protein